MSVRKLRAPAVVIVVAAVVLGILHQDCWWWDDGTAVFGFLPLGLAFHALYSILAACLWACAVRFAWPRDLEAMAKPEPAPASRKGPE